MGTGAIVRVLGVCVLKAAINPLNLESLTYTVERSAVPHFRQDVSPISKTDRLDRMFPLALPSNVTSVRISDFSPIETQYDGHPGAFGLDIANFCCDVCPYIINGISSDTPYNSANGVEDFHIQLASYLKDKRTELMKFLKRGRMQNCSFDNPRCGGVFSIPQNEMTLNFSPNTNIQEAQPSMTVEWNDGELENCYVYTIMAYTQNGFEQHAKSAIRIIVNDSEAMTPDEFKNFCTSPEN